MVSLRSQRTFLAIAAVASLALGIVQVFLLPAGASAEQALRAANSGAEIGPFFVGLGAALFTASDLATRQFGLTLLQLNNRALVYAAKVLVVLAGGAAVGAVPAAIAMWFAVSATDWPAGATWGDVLVLPILNMGFGLLGAAIGMIARSTVGAVFVYLASVWALPLVVAVLGIWVPALSGPVLQFAPVTITAAMLDRSTQSLAMARFGSIDAVLLVVGFVRVFGWRIR
jgi:hypothetical protein